MNDLVILVGLISFPGLVATIICDKILVHTEKWASFKYAVYTFILGVAAYLALQIIVGLVDLSGRYLPFLGKDPALNIWGILTDRSNGIRWGEIAWATALAPFVAGIAAVITNKKIVNKVAQLLRISDKYGDENLFSYFLNSPDVRWVYVRDIENNLSYRGLVKSFAETKEVQEVVLTDVTVFDYENSDELYSVERIYLAKPAGSFVIETPQSEPPRGLCNDGQEDSAT